MTIPANQTPGPDHRAETPNRWIHDPKIRKYLYLGVALLLAVLVVVGLVTEDQISETVRLTGWILGLLATVLASVNTPEKEKP